MITLTDEEAFELLDVLGEHIFEEDDDGESWNNDDVIAIRDKLEAKMEEAGIERK